MAYIQTPTFPTNVSLLHASIDSQTVAINPTANPTKCEIVFALSSAREYIAIGISKLES